MSFFASIPNNKYCISLFCLLVEKIYIPKGALVVLLISSTIKTFFHLYFHKFPFQTTKDRRKDITCYFSMTIFFAPQIIFSSVVHRLPHPPSSSRHHNSPPC